MFSFLSILVLSFLLGMRHATDPDHVVAITTIVARHPGLRKAGLIGALWGIGHTCTIFVIGAMIILFQVTIPPRLGLSMEFAVAAMLVLLGILNLTGTLPRRTRRGRRLFRKLAPSARLMRSPRSKASPGYFGAWGPTLCSVLWSSASFMA